MLCVLSSYSFVVVVVALSLNLISPLFMRSKVFKLYANHLIFLFSSSYVCFDLLGPLISS